MVVNGTKRKLIIKKCNPKTDRGRIECKCGVVTTGTEFFVKPALKSLKNLQDTEAIEEETVELALEVTKPGLRAKWIRNGRTINPNEERFANRYNITSEGCVHKLVIKNVQLKDAGEFVVQVEEISDKCNLTVKECEKLPKVDISQIPKLIKIKAGKDAEIEVPYQSFPIPKAQWKKDGNQVDGKPQKNDETKASLKLEKAQRGDTGQYELILQNNKGEIRVPIEVHVIDKPGSPEGPLKVSDVYKDNMVLSWQPPKDDGGSPIEHYVIEKMDVARGEWTSVSLVSSSFI